MGDAERGGRDQSERSYLMTPWQLAARHVRAHGQRAMLSGISISAVLAGFLSASHVDRSLLFYIEVAAALAALTLLALAHVVRLPSRWRRRSRWQLVPGAPRQVTLTVPAGTPSPRPRPAASCHDPVYGAGLRALLAPSRPMVVIPSNQRDVGRGHELPLPLFNDQKLRRSRVEVDPRSFGIPLSPYTFERELPEGVQDTDHTLAVKDLVYVPELAAVLRGVGDPAVLRDAPVMWPEHCVDPAQLAEHDVVVVGGPDTNFWHGALFEPIAREFGTPPSRVPLALDLREAGNGFPVYGSRAISAQLVGLGSVFGHTRQDRAELDERLYPTYGMVIACRNPLAAAVGLSRWCVFVAGTRSLGTSGAVLALVMMLEAMRRDEQLNFFSEAPAGGPDGVAGVSAVLCRTIEVEQSVLRRDGTLTDRARRRLAPEGLDPRYSDSYIPTEIEYLSYPGGPPRWQSLGRLSGP